MDTGIEAERVNSVFTLYEKLKPVAEKSLWEAQISMSLWMPKKHVLPPKSVPTSWKNRSARSSGTALAATALQATAVKKG